MQLVYSASVLEQNHLMVMAAPRGTENGNAVFDIWCTYGPELLQDFSMAHLKELLWGATGFVASDLRRLQPN